MKRRNDSKVWLVRLMFVVSGLAASGLGVKTAAAQSVCFPVGGGGVPGLPGLPDWWTSNAPYDDPRWIGSYGYSYGASEFNALVDTTGGAGHKALVLRWHVKADPGTAGPGDQVWVGFFNPDLRRQRDGARVPARPPPEHRRRHPRRRRRGVFAGAAYTRAGTSGLWSSAPVPATILSQARLDTFCDTSVDPVTCDEWVVRLRIPMSAADGGINLGDTFDMWYETDIEHSDTHTADYDNWPVGAAIVDPTADPLTFPEPLGSASPTSVAWQQREHRGRHLRGGRGDRVAGHHGHQRHRRGTRDRREQHQQLRRQADQPHDDAVQPERDQGAPAASPTGARPSATRRSGRSPIRPATPPPAAGPPARSRAARTSI